MKINNRSWMTGFNAFALAILYSSILVGCQPTEKQEPVEAAPQPVVAVVDTIELRPAPEFFIIPPGTERKRVMLCDNNSDVFHLSKDCEVLAGCVGNKRNVSLQRAIEEYGRYNCEVCSKELSDIFDEDKERFIH